MTSTEDVDTSTEEAGQTSDRTSDPLGSSRFNVLSTSMAFAVTGLIVVYLPGLMGKSLDWTIEGRFLGIALAIFGVMFGLVEASKLTGRSGFSYWGFSVLTGTLTAAFVGVAHLYRLPKLLVIILIVLTICLVLIWAYGMVSGFTIFFDEPGSAQRSQESGKDAVEKELSRYDRITLIIAVISGIATVVAAVEPIVHP
jgi:hypothetical protein